MGTSLGREIEIEVGVTLSVIYCINFCFYSLHDGHGYSTSH
jgi:hypothetical protein